jgi:hypothetical protein
MSISRRTLSVVIIALFATASLSAASVQGSFQRTFQVSGPVDLELLTRSGDIIVHSGAAGTVSVNGKIHVGDRWFEGSRQSDVSELEKNPPVRQSGNSIHIDYVNMRNISIDYEVTVPPDTAVRARSGSGNQEIEGLRSKLDLESGSGDMRLRDVSGDIHVHTGSGNVEGREVSGPLTAEETSAWKRKEAATFVSIPARGILNCTRSMARCEPRREAVTSALTACKKVIGT